MTLNRRQFAQLIAGGASLATASRSAQTTANASGTISIPLLVNGSIQLSGSVTLPDPTESGIQHIVVVMMENRSFDHFFGWMPGADGKQANLTYVDKNGKPQSTYPLAPDYTGCSHSDPDHSYGGSRVAYDNGNMDGFLRAGSNDIFTIGYYVQQDIPFYAALAQNYTVCDRYFASILGPTFPNRMYLWSGQTDRLDDSIAFTGLTTIFDRLSAAGVSHRYYFNNIPYLAFWGFKYLFSSSTFSSFLKNAAAGSLPSVSFVDPNYTVLDDGTGNDDHPHADIRNGDAFLSTVFRALTSSPQWKNTVLIITFDEWGGFFEHVAPPRVVAPNKVDTDLVNGDALLGFRLPVVVASPFTRHPAGSNVSSVVFDHTSILKLIEWRWNLAPLTARDASDQIGNLAAVMNFQSPDPGVPSLPVVTPVPGKVCLGGGIFSSSSAPSAQTFAQPEPAMQSTSPFAPLASSTTVQQWLTHPRFAVDR